MKKYFIIFLLLIPIVNANLWYFTADELKLSLNITSSVNIVPESGSYSISYLKINLSFYPQTMGSQNVLDMEIKPNAEEKDDALLFEWDSPEPGKLEYGITSIVKTENTIPRIVRKVDFPIRKKGLTYVEPSESVDSDDDEIIRLASELAAGEDDLFVVVFKLADWVKNNIEYDLSTSNVEASKTASWVLQNKNGVCDELTNLFIALNRALGIPAKFISGVAYTNSPDFQNEWGPHGWAEVYFPGHGWIPFDVTYGEFGFVDPTHIKLKEAEDADFPSTQYQWLANRVDIKTQKLKISTGLIRSTGVMEPLFSIKTDPLKSNICFGSYNLIESKIKNLGDFYLATEISLSKPNELEIVDEESKNILLKPREEAVFYWIVKLKEDLQKNSIYTIPVATYSTRNYTHKAEFKARHDDTCYLLEQIEEILSQRQEEETKTYSRDVSLDCIPSVDEVYQNEEAVATCTIANTGNVYLKDVDVCLEETCRKMDLGITQDKEIKFNVDTGEEGKREVIINAKNNQISKLASFEIDVMDKPKLGVSDLEYPATVNFDDEFSIAFTLTKLSRSDPENIIVKIKQHSILQEWSVKNLNEEHKFILKLRGQDLSSAVNVFEIIVDYKDKNDGDYQEKESINIELEKLTIMQRIYLFFNKVSRSLENLIRK